MNSFSCYQMCDLRWYEYFMFVYFFLLFYLDIYFGKKIVEFVKEYNGEEEFVQCMEDVKDFWLDVEEKEVKFILDKFEL